MTKLFSKPILFVISSPSGAGKSSLASALVNSEEHLEHSVSFTTRPKRENERDGVDYHFVTRSHFQELIENNQLVEYAEVYGNYYGTPRYSISRDCDMIFDLDWNGARSLTKALPDDVISIYILPPSFSSLKSRLCSRNQDSIDVINNRLSQAREEMKHYIEYDYVIINDIFVDSLMHLRSIIAAERLKRLRQHNLADFVMQICNNDI